MRNRRHLGLKRLLTPLLFLVLVSLPVLSFGATYNLKEYFPLKQGDFRIYKETEENGEIHIDAEAAYADGRIVVNGLGCTRVFTRGGEECEYGGWYEDGLRLYRWEAMEWKNSYEIYEPYLLICPLQLETGKLFTSQCSYKCYEDGTLAHQGPLRIELQALGEEQVIVPIGTFNCLKIHGKVQWTPSDEQITHIWEADIWLARGIGVIKMDLIDLTPGEEEETPSIYELIFNYPGLPTVGMNIVLNQTNFTTGQTLTAEAHVTNDGTPDEVGVKVWVELPGGGLVSLFDIPKYTVPANANFTVTLFSYYFGGNEPSGNYNFGGRFLNWVNGDTISEDIEPFAFTP